MLWPIGHRMVHMSADSTWSHDYDACSGQLCIMVEAHSSTTNPIGFKVMCVCSYRKPPSASSCSYCQTKESASSCPYCQTKESASSCPYCMTKESASSCPYCQTKESASSCPYCQTKASTSSYQPLLSDQGKYKYLSQYQAKESASSPYCLRRFHTIITILDCFTPSWPRDSCNKSSYIRFVYSQCHVDSMACTEQNVTIKLSQKSHNFMFMFHFWLKLATGGHGHVICMCDDHIRGDFTPS